MPEAVATEPNSAVAIAIERARVVEQVRSCTRCGLRATCTAPVPFRGATPARLSIVGEAPGAREDERGEPFVGRSGELLDTLLREAGIDPADACIFNANSCRPPGNRTPTPDEREACRPNFMAQLALADSPWVLLLGAAALSVFRADVRISQVHGYPMYWERTGRWLFPTFHPAAALRSMSYMRPLKVDLAMLSAYMRSEHTERASLCVSCKGDVDRYDGWGLPYCEQHYPKGQ